MTSIRRKKASEPGPTAEAATRLQPAQERDGARGRPKAPANPTDRPPGNSQPGNGRGGRRGCAPDSRGGAALGGTERKAEPGLQTHAQAHANSPHETHEDVSPHPTAGMWAAR